MPSIGPLCLLALFAYGQDVQSLPVPVHFVERIVHMDLKGAPPRVDYFLAQLQLFAKMGATAVLVEYEDQFPWHGERLAVLRGRDAYSAQDIENITQTAQSLGLELIPLTQTFGHLEFVLKHDEFATLSESAVDKNTVCPSTEKTYELLAEMLRQIRDAHPFSSRVHIGSDEAYHIAEDERCHRRTSCLFKCPSAHEHVETLKLGHIARVATLARDVGFSAVLAWNDMFQYTSVEMIKRFRLGDLITPVLWGYKPDVTTPGYFPNCLVSRLSKGFNSFYVAGAYKGANGDRQIFIESAGYHDNLLSYVRYLRQNSANYRADQLAGIILTGWSRYSHAQPLCEPSAEGLPSLALLMAQLEDVDRRDGLIARARHFLGCTRANESTTSVEGGASIEKSARNCSFPSHELFDAIEDLRTVTHAVRQWERGGKKGERARLALMRQLIDVRTTLGVTLTRFHFNDTVDEIWRQNVRPLEEKLLTGMNVQLGKTRPLPV